LVQAALVELFSYPEAEARQDRLLVVRLLSLEVSLSLVPAEA
jgi:hypothetical protein